MRLRRAGGFAFLLGAVGIVAVAPAAAQSVNKRLIEQLNFQLLYVAIPLTLFVEVILIYAVVRFRNNDDPLPTAEDPPLEITWTIATAIILLFVGVAAYTVLASPYITPEQPSDSSQAPGNATASGSGPVTVRGLAYQWGWQFSYPGTNVTTQSELVVPANTDIYIEMTSADVIHSLFVPRLGVKQDVFPRRTTIIHTRVFEPGTYRGYCTEFCGSGHALMRTTVRVLPEDEYRRWLRDNAGATNGTASNEPAPNATAANAPS
ncbi:cytochrome c oxidase subunit II [Haladaptatus salinisoli]|uniref:cytochrome c oxidase subunit II n=1 Tax=Haladaptatus salinisoli TaxID=2884876 RepID=UPI001D0BAFA2|nr:cytochrome c oxidase subunit II [Haladaptatus salinisoli]